MSSAERQRGELEALCESWAGWECPVPGCYDWFTTANGAGKHLMFAHEDGRRWADDGPACMHYRDDGHTVILSEESLDEWISCSHSVKLPNEPDDTSTEER